MMIPDRMRTAGGFVAGVALAWAIACGAAPAADWTLVDRSLASRRVEIARLDERGLTLSDGTVLGLDAVVDLRRERPREAARDGGLVLHRADGQRWLGRPLGIDGAYLRWDGEGIGGLRAAPEQIRGIARGGVALPASGPRDRVILLNGDQVEGVVLDLTAEHLLLQTSGGASIPVAWETLAAAVFAGVGAATPPEGTGWRLELVDGSVVDVEQFAVADGRGSARPVDGEAAFEVASDRLVGAERLGGAALWLESLPPSLAEHAPYLGDASGEAWQSVSAAGGDVAQGQAARRGIAVRPRSSLAWIVPEGYARVRTGYALAGEGRYADVTVRVLVDGRTVHEEARLRPGAVGGVVDAPVSPGAEVRFEVDYGAHLDVQDRLIWIDAALLREDAGRQ